MDELELHLPSVAQDAYVDDLTVHRTSYRITNSLLSTTQVFFQRLETFNLIVTYDFQVEFSRSSEDRRWTPPLTVQPTVIRFAGLVLRQRGDTLN